MSFPFDGHPTPATNDPTKTKPTKVSTATKQNQSNYSDLLDSELPADCELAAHFWFEYGFTPIPIVPKTKSTARQWVPWCDNLSHQSISDHWADHPDHEVGFIVDERFIVIDADSPEAIAALDGIEKAFDLNANLIVQTRHGEHHYYKRARDTYARMDSHSTEKHPERLDVRTGRGNGKGRSMVILPPSTGKTTIRNEAENAHDLIEVGQDFIDAIAVHNGREPPRKRDPGMPFPTQVASCDPDANRVERILSYIPSDCGYQDWTQVLMGLYNTYGGNDEGLQIADTWSSTASNYCGRQELEYKWHSFDGYGGTPITIGSLIKMAYANGASAADIQGDVEMRSEHSPMESSSTNISLPAPTPIENARPLKYVFPDVSGSGRILTTIPNVRHMLHGYDIVTRYDVISKRILITIPGHRGTDDNIENTTLAHVISLANLNGMAAGQVPQFVAAIADQTPVNPVADWINSHPWDGIDRLTLLYATIKTHANYPPELKRTLMFRWLLSAVAALFEPNGFRARGVLVFQGPQAIGKTTWILNLIDDPLLRESVIKIDHHLDAGNKDSILSAISHWIVEIGELDSSFKKDIARLKGFITNDKDKVRRPYDRRSSEYQRRTVFLATVNGWAFLVDDSGNSRWWTIAVVAIDYQHKINMQQLWAQVAAIYHEGTEQWWLTAEEERELEKYNMSHRSVSAIRDALLGSLQMDAPKELWTKRTASQVLQELGYSHPGNPQARECGAVLRDLFGEPKTVQGKTRWLVPPMSPFQATSSTDDDDQGNA